MIGHDLNRAQITAVLRGVLIEDAGIYSGLCGHRLSRQRKNFTVESAPLRRLESGHSLCCIQFEQGEQALEQDLIDRGNLISSTFLFGSCKAARGCSRSPNRSTIICFAMIRKNCG